MKMQKMLSSGRYVNTFFTYAILSLISCCQVLPSFHQAVSARRCIPSRSHHTTPPFRNIRIIGTMMISKMNLLNN